MKKVNNKLKAFILAIALAIISAVVIILFGNTYTIEVDNIIGINRIEDLDITIEDEDVVKCVDKSFENGTLRIKLESVSKGKSYVNINNNAYSNIFPIYVHNFGIITFIEFMGDSNGSIIIPISMIIFSLYVLYLLVISYKKRKNENMYQYINIAYLGIIIVAILMIALQYLANVV